MQGGKIDWSNITLNDVWVALRRRFYMRFRKKYVAEGLKARRGSCAGCANMGDCCNWNGCPHSDEKMGCKIYDSRTEHGFLVCQTTPFDEKDVHKRLYYFCKQKYTWNDPKFASTLLKEEK